MCKEVCRELLADAHDRVVRASRQLTQHGNAAEQLTESSDVRLEKLRESFPLAPILKKRNRSLLVPVAQPLDRVGVGPLVC